MKRILVLLGRYYPIASPNSICMQNILDSLPKEEYEVEIICYDDYLKTNTNYKITKISRGFIQTQIYKNEKGITNKEKMLFKFFTLLNKLKMIPFIPIWPWVDPIVTLKELKAAKNIYKSNPFDIIIAVYMPLSSIIVAHMLKKIDPKVKYIAYFLDSLSGGYVPHFMKKNTYNRKSIQWEKRLLRNADRVVFMQSSKKIHERIYINTFLESKIKYLDLPMLKKQKVERIISNEIRLVYVGSIALNIRSPKYFLEVFSHLADCNIKLYFIGESNCDVLNEYAKRDKRIIVIGRCSHEEALVYEQSANALINLGNKNPNLTPSKVFEYMSFGKKIISTFCSEMDSSLEYLMKYDNCLLMNENDSNIENAALRLRNFLFDSNSVTISYEQLKKTYYDNSPEAFISILSELGK